MSNFAVHLRNKGSSARAQRDGTSFEDARESNKHLTTTQKQN